MVTITYGNSYSSITGLTPQQFKALKEALSYSIDKNAAYFSGRTWATKRSLLSKSGEFPTGLTERVHRFISADCVRNKVVFNLNVKVPLRGIVRTPAFKPYPDQELATGIAVGEGRGTISMPTGTGKSNVIALIAARLAVRTLVVVPTLEIKKQLTAGLLASLNDTSLITVENIDSTALKTMKDFDCLIIDEAHHVAAKTYQKLNRTAWNGIYYRFFLTATPFRNDSDENLLFEAIAGQVIYNLTYKDAVARKYIVPVESYYIEAPTKPTDAYTYAQVYSELVVNNTEKNELIAVMLARLNVADKATLCLVKEVKHGKILSELTGIPFVHGEDDESRDYIRQFNSGGIKALIGTTGILGEGIDTKPCEYVIIAGGGKAKSQFMQAVGRSVRTYPGKESAKVILVKDRSHKFLTRHFNAQRSILKQEYNSVAVRINI